MTRYDPPPYDGHACTKRDHVVSGVKIDPSDERLWKCDCGCTMIGNARVEIRFGLLPHRFPEAEFKCGKSESAAKVQRFRKKPVVIEAVQFTDAASLSLIEWWSDGNVAYNDEAGVYCVTLEGPLCVSDNDWIVKGVQGEFYPVKPDIFEETYEPVT